MYNLSSKTRSSSRRGSTQLAFTFALAGCLLASTVTVKRVQTMMQVEQDYALNMASAAGSAELDGTLAGIDSAVDAVVATASLELPRAEIGSDDITFGIYDANGTPPFQAVMPDVSNVGRINALQLRY
jgi:hypothetical protein